MHEFLLEVRRTLLQMTILVLVMCAGAYLAGRGTVAVGLLVGLAAGIVYYLLLGYRVKKCIAVPVDKAVFIMRIGWGIRFVFIILVLLAALINDNIDFFAVVVGLFSLHIVMIINAVVSVAKEKMSNK